MSLRIPNTRRGDLDDATAPGEFKHVAHIIDELREQFNRWLTTFTNADNEEAIAELQMAEMEVNASNRGADGSTGAGNGIGVGYYERILYCICLGATKLKSNVCVKSKRSGLANLVIDLDHLKDVQPLLGALLEYPGEVTLIIDEELKRFADSVLGDRIAVGDIPFTGLKCTFVNHPSPSALRNLDPAVDILSLVSIKGICLRLSTVIPEMQVAVFRCTGTTSMNFQYVTCNNEISMPVINGVVEEPVICEQCQGRKTFVLEHNRCVFISKQLCKLQEHPDEIVEGEPPQMIFLYLYDNLVDNCKAGDMISVVGVYKPLRSKVSQRTTVLKGVHRVAIDVMSITPSLSSSAAVITLQSAHLFTANFVSEAHALASRPDCTQILTNSFAPEIWGLGDVKMGLLCQLFGGVTEYVDDGSKRIRSRGDIHILLCGDPAVAKSQLLRYVNKLSARSVYVVGSGATSAGLTASVVRDPETKETVIESGAILLSDNGICCLDEFDKMEPTTRAVLHEVMEQQTISFAKAGIISSLNARTSILASANPIRSKYDRSKTIVENINLPNNLMTRFDLIFLCLDVPNELMDAKLSKHVCSLFSSEDDRPAGTEEPTIDPKFFAQYVAYARASCKPEIPPETQRELLDVYVQLRYASSSNPIGNPRQLDSLIRLSTALAKMELKPNVESKHVKEAARLIRVATYAALTDKSGKIDYDQLITGKSSLQRQRQTLLANKVLEALNDVKPEGLGVETLIQISNEYLALCASGQEQQATMLGVSEQDKAVLFGPITRPEEMHAIVELLQNTKKIGLLANHFFTSLD